MFVSRFPKIVTAKLSGWMAILRVFLPLLSGCLGLLSGRAVGGSDGDTFHFSTGAGKDTIADFTNGEDHIDLSQWTAIKSFNDLKLHHLDKAGDVVDTATAKGATNVDGMWFEVSDPAKAMDQARAAAITQARTSAAAMAAAAGVSLGDVVSISESSASYPTPYPLAGAIRDTATPVQPGTQDVQATVTVIFAIG